MKSKKICITSLAVIIAIALITNIAFAAAAVKYPGIEKGLRYLGAGVAFGVAAGGAGIGVGLAGAAAIGAIVERRELFAMYLLFIALAEAIAIYGFAMAFILM